MIGRRDALAGGVALAMLGPSHASAAGAARYGLIGKINALAGQRSALIAALAGGSKSMPGCLAYVVAEEIGAPDVIWVTEIWDNAASHWASLALPQVREAIRVSRPLIAAFETIATTRPISVVGEAG